MTSAHGDLQRRQLVPRNGGDVNIKVLSFNIPLWLSSNCRHRYHQKVRKRPAQPIRLSLTRGPLSNSTPRRIIAPPPYQDRQNLHQAINPHRHAPPDIRASPRRAFWVARLAPSSPAMPIALPRVIPLRPLYGPLRTALLRTRLPSIARAQSTAAQEENPPPTNPEAAGTSAEDAPQPSPGTRTSPFVFRTGIALHAKRPHSRPFPPPFSSRPSGSFSDPLSTHDGRLDALLLDASLSSAAGGPGTRRAGRMRGRTNGDDAVVAGPRFVGAADGVGAWASRENGQAALWARLVAHFWAAEAERRAYGTTPARRRRRRPRRGVRGRGLSPAGPTRWPTCSARTRRRSARRR